MTNTQFLAADRRLTYIGNHISKAQKVAIIRQWQLDQAISAYKDLESECKKNLKSAETWFWGTVGVAAIAWYLVIFVLEGTEWYISLLIGIGAVAAAVRLHSERKKVERQVQKTLRGAGPKVDEADRRLSEALIHLKDLLLEKELCTRKVEKYRYTEVNEDHSSSTLARAK